MEYLLKSSPEYKKLPSILYFDGHVICQVMFLLHDCCNIWAWENVTVYQIYFH